MTKSYLKPKSRLITSLPIFNPTFFNYKKLFIFILIICLFIPILATANVEECTAILAAGGSYSECSLTKVEQEYYAILGVLQLLFIFIFTCIGTVLCSFIGVKLLTPVIFKYFYPELVEDPAPSVLYPELEPQSDTSDMPELVAHTGASTVFSKTADPYIKLAIQSMGFYRSISNYKHTNRSAVMRNAIFSVVQFVSSYYDASEVCEIVSIIFGGDISPEDVLEPQANWAREALNSWDDLSNSALITKFQGILTGMLTCTLTKDKTGEFTSGNLQYFMSTQPSKLKFTSANELLRSVLDFIITFAESGYECFQERSLQPALCADRKVRDWLKEYRDLSSEIDTIPINPDFDANTLLGKIDLMMGRATVLMHTHPREINPLWRIMMDRRSRLLKEHNVTGTRKPPFAVLIHGPPGIGKTSVTQLLATMYHRTVVDANIYPELEWTPSENIYVYNNDDKFWSGYKGAKHWCVILDDLASEHVRHVASGLATSIREVITIVNSVGISSNQASLEDKGCIPIIPKCVFATSNTQHLNSYHAVAEPAAVLRRFPINIKPILKPEFVDATSGMMKKLDRVERDAWTFHVQQVRMVAHPDETVSVVYDTIRGVDEFMTGAELSVYMRDKIISHERSSTIMKESLVVTDDTKLCVHGVLNYYKCLKCEPKLEPQAFWEYIPSVFGGTPLTRRQRITKYFIKNFIEYAPSSVFNYWQTYAMLDPQAYFEALDDRMHRSIPRDMYIANKIVLSVLTGVMAYSIITMLSNWCFDSTAEDVETQGNIWDALKCVSNDKFVKPSVAKVDNEDELMSSLKRGTFRLSTKNSSGNTCAVTCIALKNGWYLTVGHAFLSGDKWQCVARYGEDTFSMSPVSKFFLTRGDLVFKPNDIVLFQTGSVLPRKSLFKFLPTSIDMAGRDIRIFDPRSKVLGTGVTTKYIPLTYKDDGGGFISGNFMDGIRHDTSPSRGDCGAIVLSMAGNAWYISGIHCAGSSSISSNRMVISQLAQGDLLCPDACLSVSSMPATDIIAQGSKKSGALGPPHPTKGVHNWVTGNAVVLGSFKGRRTSSSRTVKTMIHADMEIGFDYKCPFGAPIMTPIEENGVWLNPYTISAEAQCTISPHYDDTTVLKACDAYIDDCLAIKDGWLDNIPVVNLHVAINGIEGDSYINRIPMSTSGGFYFPGQKRQYFDEVIDDEGFLICHPTQPVIDRVQYIEDCYISGDRAMILFDASLKDEPTKFSKIETGKTRVFACCDLAFSLVVRKQYLTISKAIMENNFNSECAVGMNCYSLDWEALYYFLAKFGKECLIDGDYKTFDKKMSPTVILGGFYILDMLREFTSPLSPNDALISKGVATDIAYPIINMNGDVIQFLGSNPSGQPLTVIINSLVNSMYVRIAYDDLGFKLRSFRDNVGLMTLGDDNIMRSRLPGFNHTTLQASLAARGVPYTMADKEQESVPFIHIGDCNFLKRTFRKLGDRIVGPLSLESVFKSLCMHVQKDSISNEEQLAQSYLAARREWSLHGKVLFSYHVGVMENIFENYPGVKRFFIPQHSYTFEETLQWVQGRTLEEGVCYDHCE